MNVYLDTSGLNYFVDTHSKEQIDNMKSFGIKFFISSSTIWEILMNSNKDRREELIYWGQINCENKLLKSTSEILIDYYKLNCPEKNRILFWKDPFTKLDIGKTWTNIHNDISRTIPADLNELKDFTKVNHDLSKKFKTILNDMTSPAYENKESDYFYLCAKQIAEKLDFPWEKEYQRHFIIASIITFFILCTGIELDKSLIRKFWKELEIEDPVDRLDFLIANMPMLFESGPIAEMTYMVQTQLSMKNSKSRGLLHDCFHLAYAYFTDFLITNDKHFGEFRDTIKHESFSRIIVTDEIEQMMKNIRG
jgi:hypothetical protein